MAELVPFKKEKKTCILQGLTYKGRVEIFWMHFHFSIEQILLKGAT